MTRVKFRLMVLFGLIFNFSLSGQGIKIPEWIEGTWNNSAESRMNNREYWTFLNDSILLIKGLPSFTSDTTCLNEKYSDYKTTTKTTDSLFRLKFSKEKEKVIYEFKLQNVYYEEEPVLTYSIKVNGEVKKDHSKQVHEVLTKTILLYIK